MILCLEDVLSAGHVAAFVKVLTDEGLFESGQRTAGSAAKQKKSNLQAIRDKPEIARILKQVKEDLGKNAMFSAFAVPARIGRVMVSRYEPGMSYGTHFDDAFIDQVRTDLSFTIFLSEPDAYDGGELEMHSPMGTQAIKLPGGCAVIYPSDQMHAVLPVTGGVRLAIVGWVQSRVRDPGKRQILFDLKQATAELDNQSADAVVRLKMVRNNLIRMWSD